MEATETGAPKARYLGRFAPFPKKVALGESIEVKPDERMPWLTHIQRIMFCNSTQIKFLLYRIRYVVGICYS